MPDHLALISSKLLVVNYYFSKPYRNSALRLQVLKVNKLSVNPSKVVSRALILRRSRIATGSLHYRNSSSFIKGTECLFKPLFFPNKSFYSLLLFSS